LNWNLGVLAKVDARVHLALKQLLLHLRIAFFRELIGASGAGATWNVFSFNGATLHLCHKVLIVIDLPSGAGPPNPAS
jgi:hypothetical protein